MWGVLGKNCWFWLEYKVRREVVVDGELLGVYGKTEGGELLVVRSG